MGFFNGQDFLGKKYLSCWANLQFWVSFFGAVRSYAAVFQCNQCQPPTMLCFSKRHIPKSHGSHDHHVHSHFPSTVSTINWAICSGYSPCQIDVESHGSKNTSFPENFLKSMGLPHLPQASYIDFRHQETTGRVASLAILCWEYLWIGNRLPLWSDPLRLH